MIFSAEDRAARTAILHDLAARADERLTAVDPAEQPQGPDAWVTQLVGSLGCLPFAAGDEERAGLLADHAALTLLWLEQLEREGRAA